MPRLSFLSPGHDLSNRAHVVAWAVLDGVAYAGVVVIVRLVVRLDAWSTPYLVSWLAILLALAAYGFWVSLAGQPIFKDMIAEPIPAR